MRRPPAPPLAAVLASVLAALLAGAAALLAGGGCARRPAAPHVLLVVLDTVRRDFTDAGPEGGPGFTPCLARLAREGVVYTNAWSVSPWTVPSHASLFTGLLPSQHGCTGLDHRFAPPQPTLAEALGEAGYETAAFYSNPWLADRTTGLLRGFARQYETPIGGMGRLVSPAGDQGGRSSLGHFAAWLEARDRRRPFFAFVNFLEAHLAYDPPADYRAAHLADLPPADAVSIAWGHEFNAGLHPPEFVDWLRVRRLYGGDVNTADRLLDGLLQLLRQHGLYEETVIIVTSDHGENLGEHGLLEHQFSVHETVLAVPLVIRAPVLERHGMALLAGAGGALPSPHMLTDLYDAVLAIAGLPPVSTDPPDARRLVFRRLPGEEWLAVPLDRDRPLVAEYEGPSGGLLGMLRQLNPQLDPARLAPAYRTVRSRDWRWTVGSDGSRRLHDVARDPLQGRDLSAEHPRVAARLDSLLAAATGGRPLGSWGRAGAAGGGAEGLDEATRRQLRSLGYVR